MNIKQNGSENYMNIKQNGSENGTCVSLKGVKWKREDQQPAEEIYFATDGLRFKAEKFDEILKWKDMGAYEEVDDTGQPRIPCRWVCTEKMKGDTVQRKARLCARSYEEVNNQVKRDSPTYQKESLRLLLCILSAQQWTLHSMDIKSAYLQGVPLDRELYMTPPKEATLRRYGC